MKKFSFQIPIVRPLRRNNFFDSFNPSKSSFVQTPPPVSEFASNPLIPNRNTGKLERLSKIMSLKDESQFIDNVPKGPVYAVYHHNKTSPNKVFTNWPECKSYTSGRKSITYKKFNSSEEAHVWLDSKEHVPVPDGAEIVYTDGACSNNQNQKDARAGVGVYFGKNDQRNISEPLEGDKQTNNRAELTAAIKAIEVQCTNGLGKQKPLLVVTDSNYVVQNATENLQKWALNGYKRKDNNDLENIDLWMQMKKLLDSRTAYPVIFKWIKGHTNLDTKDAIGNKEADLLAVQGITKKRKTTTTTTLPSIKSIVNAEERKKPATTATNNKFAVSVDLTKDEELDDYETMLIEKLNEHRAKKRKLLIPKLKLEFVDDD